MKFNSKLKIGFFVLMMGGLLAGCSNSSNQVDHSPPANYDPQAMPGMPCHKMGNTYMGDCEFDAEGNLIKDDEVSNTDHHFSTSTEGLEEATPSEIIELKNGDTYKMTASLVKQEIGNQEIKRLAYNGQIPGPLLKVEKNAEITLEFENQLDIETTLHSHGLRLDNAFDGTPGVTQKPIQPGESFTYKIKFPDEGIYWYHPHIREDYTQELGLYGNMLVEPLSSTYWNPVSREEVLIFDDLLIADNQPSFSQEQTNHALMGRFGNVMLLNNETNYQTQVQKNEVMRLYLTNVANTRVFNIEIPGASMKLVGGDIGRIEKEQKIDSILMGPAERMIVEVQFPEEGTFEIIHQTPEKKYVMGQIVVEGEVESTQDFEKMRENVSDYSPIRNNLEKFLNQPPDKSLRLSIEMAGMEMGGMMENHHMEGIEWEDTMGVMNRSSNSENTVWKLIDEATQKENMEIDWTFKEGDWVKIRVFNDPNSMHPMQHPIHFHGQRFVILAEDGEVNENFQWKDTALIETGQTLDLLVEMSNPGQWMAHCHIAEHLHSGMMLGFEVQKNN